MTYNKPALYLHKTRYNNLHRKRTGPGTMNQLQAEDINLTQERSVMFLGITTNKCLQRALHIRWIQNDIYYQTGII